MTYFKSSSIIKTLHVNCKPTSNTYEMNEVLPLSIFWSHDIGKDSNRKLQHGSTSKTVTRAQNLLSSASQSILNLTSKKLVSRRQSPSESAVQKKSKQLGSNLPKASNAISGKTTITVSKQLQSSKGTLEKERSGEPSVKRKIPPAVLANENFDRRNQKSESKPHIVKKSFANDNSVAKSSKFPKKTLNICDKQSSANSKKKESKLCFSYSSRRKKTVKEHTVETKKADNKRIEKSINEIQDSKSEVKKSFEYVNDELKKPFRHVNDDFHPTIKESCISSITKHSSIEEQPPWKRENKGRLGNPNVKSDSELYGDAHLKSILKVLRSNLSPEAKLSAIKCSHDYWQKIENGDIEWDQVDKILKFSINSAVDTKKHVDTKTENSETESEVCHISDNLDSIKKQYSEPKSSSTNTSLHVNANFSGGMSDQSTIGISAEILNEPSVLPSLRSEIDHLVKGGVPTVISVNVTDDDHKSRSTPPPKSPVTVQEWVNSIDLTTGDERAVVSPKLASSGQGDTVTSPMCENPTDDLHSPVNMQDGAAEDNLTLGAEAYNLEGVHCYISRHGNSDMSPSSLSPKTNKITLGDLHFKQSSFNSETSCLSGLSSISSVESLLESRKEDPEEILLALGFGGKQTYDPISRIPQRFLSSPSSVRGVTVESFLQQQEDLMQRQDNSCLGYLGLSVSPHLDGQPSSALASRILDKLEASEKKQRKFSSGSSTSLQDIVSIMRAANAFRTGKMRHSSDSILDPANREFLEKQGKIDPLERAKKLILGMHTYSFDQEGGLVQSSENENEDSLLSRVKSSKWKEMYKKLEDQASCVDEVDEENLKNNPDGLEAKNKSWFSQKERNEPKEIKAEKESKVAKKRPLICRQSRIEDNVFDDFNKDYVESTISPCASGMSLKQPLKQKTCHIHDTNAKQDNIHLNMKGDQHKDSFELDELSPAEGLENEALIPTSSSWIEAEATAPCNFSDSSGFAEDVAPESTYMIEHSKKHSREMSLPKETEFASEYSKLLQEKKTYDKRSDETRIQRQDYSTELANQDSTLLQHSKKLPRLKRAYSFVQGHNNSTNIFAAINDQRRHSATTPGEMIFTQLKRGSSLWHLHPPLLWNNLNDLSYMSSSEATLTSHQSTDKICEDISDSVSKIEKNSALFISTKNIWLSSEKNESKQCHKPDFCNIDKNYFSRTKEHQNTSEMEIGLCTNDDNFTSSSLLSHGATSQSLHKIETSNRKKYNFDKLLVDCLFSKLNSLKKELENSISRHLLDASNRNSNSRSLMQLREGLLAQIGSIENLLLHELQNLTLRENVVHAAQEMIELIFQQHAVCDKFECISEEEKIFQKAIPENNKRFFTELKQEDKCQTTSN